MIDFKDYSKKRSILRKRLERLLKAGYESTRAEAILAKLNTDTTASVRKLSERKQERKLEQLEGWLSLKSLTVTGRREQEKLTLARLQELGYKVTKENLPQLGRMMQTARAFLKGAQYDSSAVADTAIEYIDNYEGFINWLMAGM